MWDSLFVVTITDQLMLSKGTDAVNNTLRGLEISEEVESGLDSKVVWYFLWIHAD